jgi:hypothetical protein
MRLARHPSQHYGMVDGHRCTIEREGGILFDPARFVMAARRAASNPGPSDLIEQAFDASPAR